MDLTDEEMVDVLRTVLNDLRIFASQRAEFSRRAATEAKNCRKIAEFHQARGLKQAYEVMVTRIDTATKGLL